MCYFNLGEIIPSAHSHPTGGILMKAVGFLMLLAGWFLVLAAIVLFAAPSLRVGFVLAGVAVEVLGLVLAFRAHLIPREEKR